MTSNEIFILIIIGVFVIIFFVNKSHTDAKITSNEKQQKLNNEKILMEIVNAKEQIKQNYSELVEKIQYGDKALLIKFEHDIRVANSLLDALDERQKKALDVYNVERSKQFENIRIQIKQNYINLKDQLQSGDKSTQNELIKEIKTIDQKHQNNLDVFNNDHKRQIDILSELLRVVRESIEESKIESKESLLNITNLLVKKINDIKNENDLLRKKLEQFSEIKNDSTRLNETIDVEKENELIENILKNKQSFDQDEFNAKLQSLNEKKIFDKDIEFVNEPFIEVDNEDIEILNDDSEVATLESIEEELKPELKISSENLDDYELITYGNVQELYNKVKHNLSQHIPVYIKIGKKYSIKSYIDTIHVLESISILYPNKNIFYARFNGHNIGCQSVDLFLLKKDFVPIIDKVEPEKTSIGLDEQQEKAYHMMEKTNANLFISGKAGTGKSFLLRLFSKGTKKKHIIVAPTGIAALNVGGVTIHSAFGFSNLEPGNTLEVLKLNSEKQQVLKNIDVLIIDEISMVRTDVLDQMNLILQKVNRNEELFGGKQIIIFGDLFQLPPIAKKEEYQYLKDRYGGIYFFHANAYKEGNFQFIELFHNHRQNGDEAFFNILNNIRIGDTKDEDIYNLNRRYDESLDLRRIVKLYPKKEKVEQINNEELSKIEVKEYVFEAEILYTKDANLTKNIENIFPININLKLKLGALIMMVKNDINKRWVNGTLGIVSHIDDKRLKVTIDGTEYEVKKESFENREAKYSGGQIYYQTILEVEQYPLILAYAITIHKSQGMTYKNVACDLRETFEDGQSYVALSRCSSLEGLHLMNKISGKEIRVNPSIVSFYKSINSLPI